MRCDALHRAAGACQRIATELLAEAERRFGQGRAQESQR
jgi:hypothetical protein